METYRRRNGGQLFSGVFHELWLWMLKISRGSISKGFQVKCCREELSSYVSSHRVWRYLIVQEHHFKTSRGCMTADCFDLHVSSRGSVDIGEGWWLFSNIRSKFRAATRSISRGSIPNIQSIWGTNPVGPDMSMWVLDPRGMVPKYVVRGTDSYERRNVFRFDIRGRYYRPGVRYRVLYEVTIPTGDIRIRFRLFLETGYNCRKVFWIFMLSSTDWDGFADG